MIIGKTRLKKHNPVIDWTRNSVAFASGYCQAHCLPVRHSEPILANPDPQVSSYKIAMISRAAFKYAANSAGPELFVIAASTIRDKPDTNPAKHPDYPANIVPEGYHQYLPLFAKEEADKLPPHRYVDHEIPIGDNKLSISQMYSMSDSKLAEVRKWITENLFKGFIRASSSSCASPILFVKQKEGSLRLCVDYRALNDITTKDRYPLPGIEETLN